MLDVIWKNRNDLIWHNESEEATKMGLLAFHNWQDWYKAQKDLDNENVYEHNLDWSPPPEGWLKCNVDAGFNKQGGTTNRGWCVRDDTGNFIFAGIAWDIGTLTILEAEALALKEAIQGAISSQLDKVIFESDSQGVVQAIDSNYKGDSEFSLIIKSINSLLQAFPNFEVKFIKRQANSVAHSLAKAANSWSRRSFIHLIPPCIEQHLINEMH
ncbi:uncharacterized protein LOC131619666 [Vicia villosa]|uniref:uncharacterized protein LOC131619666 n=1 Tax=Vicia villosa TaxID=3911 RepID=UPI00273C8F9F|nr:uncharacterized protein LOC131619666 [Vicia villosa]